jgi:hypothetical protein
VYERHRENSTVCFTMMDEVLNWSNVMDERKRGPASIYADYSSDITQLFPNQLTEDIETEMVCPMTTQFSGGNKNQQMSFTTDDGAQTRQTIITVNQSKKEFSLLQNWVMCAVTGGFWLPCCVAGCCGLACQRPFDDY